MAIVTGAGDRSFCAGADLKKTIPARPGAEGQAHWRMFQPNAQPNLDDGLHLWKPVIAAVNGYCLGAGLTLLSACDIRVAVDSATFGLPEVKRGIVPTLGATQRLPPLTARAIKESVLRGQSMPLEEGMRLEQLLSQAVRQTDDFQEGPKAFAEKRVPRYRGN